MGLGPGKKNMFGSPPIQAWWAEAAAAAAAGRFAWKRWCTTGRRGAGSDSKAPVPPPATGEEKAMAEVQAFVH